MGNGKFDSIEDIDDREAVGKYNEMLEKGTKPEKAFFTIQTGTRDNSRTPFHWSDSENAGFTTGKPWLKITPDYRRYNAEDEMQNPDSVFAFYKKAIELRKTHKALVYGEFRRATGIPAPLYCYYREYNGELYYVELNLGRKPLAHPIDVGNMQLLLSTRTDKGDNLRPFEGNIYKVQ